VEAVPPGSTDEEVLEVISHDRDALLLGVALLAAAAGSIHAYAAASSGSRLRLFDRLDEVLLEVCLGDPAESSLRSALPVLTQPGGSVVAVQTPVRPYLPVDLPQLSFLISDATHYEALITLPPEMRRAHIEETARLVGIPTDVVFRFIDSANAVPYRSLSDDGANSRN
jgi:hypothetical protein